MPDIKAKAPLVAGPDLEVTQEPQEQDVAARAPLRAGPDLVLYSATRSDGAPAVGVNPATRKLTGCWIDTFAGSRWEGQASAGGSGSRDLVTVSGSPDPSTQWRNRYGVDLVSDALAADGFFADSLISATTYYYAFVVYIRSNNTYTGTITDPIIFGDNDQNFGVSYSTDGGINAFQYDTTTGWVEAYVYPAPNQNLYFVEVWHDGTTLHIAANRTDGVTAAVPMTWLNTYIGSMVPRVGNTAGANPFDGVVLALLTNDSVPSDADRDGFAEFFSDRYGVNLAGPGDAGIANGSLNTATVSGVSGSAVGQADTSGAIGTVTVSAVAATASGRGTTSGALATVTATASSGAATGRAAGTGAPGTVTVSAVAASAQGRATTSGGIGTVTVSAISGAGTETGAGTGTIGTVTVSAVAATAKGRAASAGGIGTVTASSSAASASGRAAASGAIASVSCTAIAGAGAGQAECAGGIGTVTVSAVQGVATAGGSANASGSIGTITVTAIEGSASHAASSTGSGGPRARFLFQQKLQQPVEPVPGEAQGEIGTASVGAITAVAIGRRPAVDQQLRARLLAHRDDARARRKRRAA